MIYRYQIDENEVIIGNEMPNIIRGSFTREMIRHHGITISALMEEYHKKAKGTEPTPVEKIAYHIESIKIAGTQLNDIITKDTLPDNLKTLVIENLKKKEQEKLLKGVSITYEQAYELFFLAERIGYDFTSIKFSGDPKNLDRSKLPKIAYKDDSGNIISLGGDVSEGQARQLIDQNQVLIARIISKDDHWHCFLQTFRGLKGMESGTQGGRAHLHYLSDKTTGLSFDDFLNQIQRGTYPNAPVHIPLID